MHFKNTFFDIVGLGVLVDRNNSKIMTLCIPKNLLKVISATKRNILQKTFNKNLSQINFWQEVFTKTFTGLPCIEDYQKFTPKTGEYEQMCKVKKKKLTEVPTIGSSI
jgi:hypothetical protein